MFFLPRNAFKLSNGAVQIGESRKTQKKLTFHQSEKLLKTRQSIIEIKARRQTDRLIDRQTDRNRQTDRQKYIQSDRQTVKERWSFIKTEKQSIRRIDIQTDRQ